MVSLVTALLNVSRIEMGTFSVEPEPTNIEDVIDVVLDELKLQIADVVESTSRRARRQASFCASL